MRIIFCGSGTFAVPTLRALLEARHDVPMAVTQPARPAGRGGKLRPTPVAEFVRKIGAEPWECPDINAPEAIERLGKVSADVMCVVDFGQFIRAAAREQVRVDTINVHGSLLPALRGAAPANWALIRCLDKTGVTTFSLADRMDAGDIYVQRETEILPGETAAELKIRLAELGAEAACETVGLLAGGWATGRKQDESQVTRAPRLGKSDGIIDWTLDARRVCGLICGTSPWPGGQARLRRSHGKDVPVVVVRAVPAEGGEDDELPGVLDRDLLVTTGYGRVRILAIQPAGKREMAWEDFVNGYRPVPGDAFAAWEK